ncbi:hypothetical protein Ddye_025933 [Dipteronia dyeriana]|uniref:Reverse transcriptase n=1 Tax=Dipteronia dyeriana TaxID=168575 RepID=A0AAD9TM25_9ROSI|nr:hypothetical protein Ddye_025933 [Dipteronia dyeriana]
MVGSSCGGGSQIIFGYWEKDDRKAISGSDYYKEKKECEEESLKCRGLGPSKVQNMENQKSPVEKEIRLPRKTQVEKKTDYNFNMSVEETLSSNENSISHVSATQHQSLAKGISITCEKSMIGKRKNVKNGRRLTSSCQRHGMVTRKDRSLEQHGLRIVRGRDLNKDGAKGRWNLKDEMAKLIEKGVALTVINGVDAGKRGEETKLNYFDSRIVKYLGGALLTKGIGVEATGSTGGLITLWDEEVFQVRDCISNDRCIIISGVLIKLRKKVIFCNVYATNQVSGSMELWNFIINAQVALPGTWVIEGDFNSVLHQSERIGSSCITRSIKNFNNFVNSAKVVDIPLQGLIQKGLCKSLLDHNPVMLSISNIDWEPKPFCIHNGWVDNKELMSGVRDIWKESKGSGFVRFRMFQKTKAVKKFTRALIREGN